MLPILAGTYVIQVKAAASESRSALIWFYTGIFDCSQAGALGFLHKDNAIVKGKTSISLELHTFAIGYWWVCLPPKMVGEE